MSQNKPFGFGNHDFIFRKKDATDHTPKRKLLQVYDFEVEESSAAGVEEFFLNSDVQLPTHFGLAEEQSLGFDSYPQLDALFAEHE